MKHGKGADSLSALAVNPRNREASARRREKLLAAFLSLGEDTCADLLELVESIAFNAGDARIERDDARDIIRQVYTAAGWAESSSG